MQDSPETKDLEDVPTADKATQWLGAKFQQTLEMIYEKYKDVDEGASRDIYS